MIEIMSTIAMERIMTASLKAVVVVNSGDGSVVVILVLLLLLLVDEFVEGVLMVEVVLVGRREVEDTVKSGGTGLPSQFIAPEMYSSE